jgi:hypothetical protein
LKPCLKVEECADGQHDADGKSEAEKNGDEGEEREVDLGLVPGAVVVVPLPVQSVVERHGQRDGGVKRTADGEEEEADEVAVVSVPDAVVDPRAVVVHLLDAATALAAVVAPRHLEAVAHVAELEPLSLLFVFRLPAQLDVAGPVEQGGQKVIGGEHGKNEQS